MDSGLEHLHCHLILLLSPPSTTPLPLPAFYDPEKLLLPSPSMVALRQRISAKLAANGSWHYDVVDTELWASCVAADGLVSNQPPPLACYSCGSSAHFYAACPHRRLPSNFRPTAGQKPDQARLGKLQRKGVASAVNAAPTVTHAPIAEASTPNGAAPASAPKPPPLHLTTTHFCAIASAPP